MKKILALVLALMLVLSAAAMAEGTIKLGGLAPLTGNYAEYGKGFQIGWQMAIDDIAAQGGVNGYNFEIDVKDSQGDAVVSSTLATDFAEDDDIAAILGDFTSGACKANAEIVDRYGIVQLSPTASASDYAGMSPYCFSIMGRQDGEAPFLAKYVLQKYLGAQKVAIVRVDSDWGLSCYDNFKAAADAIGLEVVIEEKYKADETDFSSIITKVKSTDPDVLVVMDQGVAVASVFNAADAAGWDITHVALGPGTSEQVVGMLTDPDNIIVTSPFFFDPDNAELTAWKDRFVELAGFQPTVHPACAYDTIMLIANAVSQIEGEVTREAICEKLTGMEYTGVTGRIKFNENGDITRDYMICGTKDGAWVVLEGFEYGQEG